LISPPDFTLVTSLPSPFAIKFGAFLYSAFFPVAHPRNLVSSELDIGENVLKYQVCLPA